VHWAARSFGTCSRQRAFIETIPAGNQPAFAYLNRRSSHRKPHETTTMAANTTCTPLAANAEQALKTFVARFEPRQQALIRAVRKALRKRFPTAYELAYDNYNFFVIGYSATERPSDAIVSITAAANGVGLCFIHGASLPDPNKVLLGSGKQTRFIRIESVEVFSRPEVEALLAAAMARAKTPLRGNGRGKLIIRSVSAKQRPRRRQAR
jgi:hypothetical protein